MLISELLIKKKLIFHYYHNSFKTKEKRIVKNSSKVKIANTYASALLEAAIENKTIAKVLIDVENLKSLLLDNSDFSTYMANPMYADDEKKSLLSEVVRKIKISATTARFIDVLFENRRLADLLNIVNEFVHLYHAHNNIAEVEVESVQNLSAAQSKKILAVLEKKLNKKVVVTCKLNPDIIGGLRVHVGSKMFDDTIITKLNHLEIMMKGEE